MKKLFRFSLIDTLGRTIVDLMTLKQKLVSFQSPASDPSALDPEEYFTGYNSCAEYLNISPFTLEKYVAVGLVKSIHSGSRVCFKKTDIEEAVANVPFLKARAEAKTSGLHFIPDPTRLNIRVHRIPGVMLLIFLSYQGVRFVITSHCRFEAHQPYIEKLCKRVIMVYHSFRPFKIKPDLQPKE